jgi:Xaa-Pro aminopeptidase
MPRKSPATPLSLPGGVDPARLRAGRLARLQAAMREHGVEACLFFNPANIRYATGTSVMAVYSLATCCRCALVPAGGAPILFEHPNSMHVSAKILSDVRPMLAWDFCGAQAADLASRWAREIRAALSELGATSSRLAVDRLDTPGFLALQREGIHVTDSGPITVDAREIKTPEEIELLGMNCRIAYAMLADFEAAIRPGVREYELLAVLADTLLRHEGEYLITRCCAAGRNTNPWTLEAGDRAIAPGDLVFVDTDAIGVEGYFADVSRTFLCGDRPTPEQKEAYRVAHDCVAGMRELARPGITFAEFALKAPALPEKYRAQRYEVMAHQAGLEDEGPSILYPDDPNTPMPERELREGMVLCLECYTGEVGGTCGVKLEDQVLVTRGAPENLCPYPYDPRLLG